MKKHTYTALAAVVGQVINMYNNNVLAENGNETFSGWCEDGAVFDEEENPAECRELMKRLAPLVDGLTNEIIGVEDECREELTGMTATELLTWIENHKEETLDHFRETEYQKHGIYPNEDELEGMYHDAYYYLSDHIDDDTIYHGNTPIECLCETYEV